MSFMGSRLVSNDDETVDWLSSEFDSSEVLLIGKICANVFTSGVADNEVLSSEVLCVDDAS